MAALHSGGRIGLVSTGESNGVCTGARDGCDGEGRSHHRPERRRRWSAEQKRAIVAESLAPEAVVAEIARLAEICPGQIYRWRRGLGHANIATTRIYDHRKTRPEDSPTFKVDY